MVAKLRAFIFITVIIKLSSTHILRLTDCNIYDAEFSKIKYHNRLVGSIITLIDLITLRKCLTKCLYLPTCYSVNYMRQDEKCELLGDAAQRNVTGAVSFEVANGWNHIETNYDRKSVSKFECKCLDI